MPPLAHGAPLRAGRTRRRRLAAALVLLLAAPVGCASTLERLPWGPASVSGELRIAGPPGARPALGPVVVYLEPHATPLRLPHLGARTLDDGDAGPLGHELVVVPSAATLRFQSRRGLEHRLFAVRGRQRIEVPVPASGRSHAIRLDEPGWTRFYCSLHDDETWDAFVAPSRLFARVDRSGRYRIRGVPPGRYRLRIWSAAVAGTVAELEVGVRSVAQRTIWLDPERIAP